MSKKLQEQTNLPVFSAAQLLDRMTPKPVLVQVPDLGGAVYIKQMSALDRITIGEKVQKLKDESGESSETGIKLSAVFLTEFLVDEAGNALFTESDIQALMQSRFEPMDYLVKEGLKINGMTNESVEDLEGNSEPGPSDDSLSTLPES